MTEVAAGRAIDDEAPKGGQHSPFGEAIKAFLGKHPMGATGGDLRLELRKTPEFAATIERHKSHLYNVLGRLVARGELTRGGGRYFLAPNAASGAMSGASEVTVRH